MSILKKIPFKVKLVSTLLVIGTLLGLFLTIEISDKRKVFKIKSQSFAIEVAAEGEIRALEYETINIPELMNKRELRIWYLKITDLVSEGTKIKKGDFIAQLDQSEVESRLKSRYEKIDELNSSLETAKLDSTIVLAEKRDRIANIKSNVEENEIKVEQSVYESKAAQRRAQINYEKVLINMNTAKRNYEKELQKQQGKIKRIEKRLKEEEKLKDWLEQLKDELYVTSPSDGIVVYGRAWGGRKIKVNDEVGRWRPIIATIPDLETLVSEAIVKEIDIAKIKIGQYVNIVIDAFPDDIFEAEVIKIANIGQPISGLGMNGFKVVIKINNKGKNILPGMTTFNKITIGNYDDAIAVPRQSVFGNDSIKFVYKKQEGKFKRKEVKIAEENDTHIRILEGLEIGDKILLTLPEEDKN